MSAFKVFRSMIDDRRGNIAMMFGLMLFVIVGAAGIAIDLQRSNMIRSAVNEATDAAILAAARYKINHPGANDTELTNVAQRVFDNSFRSGMKPTISGFAVTFDEDSGSFALDVTGTANTLIMGIFGFDDTDVGARAEVRLGKPKLIEVAMALDTTGSMGANGKLAALKSSAKELVETLFEADASKVKIGIVPFAQYVNVGTKYKTENWVSMPAGAWLGCVGSRNYPLNVQDNDYVMTPAPGLATGTYSVQCPMDLLPLSNDQTKIELAINGLAAKGNTYIPSGLIWAWSLLTPEKPFDEGVSFADLEKENGAKALIIMTDGENTKAPNYPYHESGNKTLADQLTEEICANIKAQKIVVYSIAFSVTEPNIKEVLETCATNPSYYFDAASSSELSEAFAAIATSLRNISLSK